MSKYFPVALLICAVAACGGSDASAPQNVAARLRADSVSVTGTAGNNIAFPVTVTVLDNVGHTVPGVTVTWTASDAGGVQQTTSVSNAAGKASAIWTLGPVIGAQTLTAKAAGLDAVTITASVGIPNDARLTVVSGDNQTGQVKQALAAPIVVKLTLSNGVPLRNADLEWTTPQGSGTLAGSSKTGADGTAQANWTLGELTGRQLGGVQVGGLNPVVFQATAQ